MKLFQEKWETLYEGKDEQYAYEVIALFEENRVRYRATAYTPATRLAGYAFGNLRFNPRDPSVNNQALATKLLNNKSMDKIQIEVLYKDTKRARQLVKHALGSHYYSQRAERETG